VGGADAGYGGAGPPLLTEINQDCNKTLFLVMLVLS